MRILVSACLLGCPCRYDGASKPHPAVLALAERLQEKNLVKELIMRPGYVRIAMRGADREAELVKCGLRQLERRFPRCVEVNEK